MLDLKIRVDTRKFPDLTKEDIDSIVNTVATRIRAAVVEATPIGNRKNSGATKEAWTPIVKEEGGYSFSNPTVQSIFLEYGSIAGKRPWPHAKTRTIYYHGRIYSSQAPRGMTARAEVQRLAKELTKELGEALLKGKHAER